LPNPCLEEEEEEEEEEGNGRFNYHESLVPYYNEP